MKIYIIKSTFVDKNRKIGNDDVWVNIYAVKTEKEAKEECIKLQNKANDDYLGNSFKFVYIYEEITLF